MQTLFVVQSRQQARIAGFEGPQMRHHSNPDYRVFATLHQDVEQFAGMNFQTIVIADNVQCGGGANWRKTKCYLRALLRTAVEGEPLAWIEL